MGGFVRRVLVAALACTVAVVASGCGGGDAAKSEGGDRTIKIGAVLSLTGTYAAMGTAEQNAIELEVDRINAGGGIGGAQLEVIVEDDGTDEAKAVAATSKLLEQDGVVAIIGGTGTGQTMAMRGDVDRAGVAQLSLAGGTVVTADFNKHVFQTPWSNTIVVPFVLNAIKSTGAEKIALISDSGGYGKDGRPIILEESKKLGLQVVADETFNAGDTDMTAQLTNIKGAGAQAVLMWTAGKEAATIIKSAREIGIDQPFFGGSGQARAEFASAAGDAAEGFTFGTGKSLLAANWGEGSEEFTKVNDFATRYEGAYGEAPDIFAGHAFDAVLLIEDALKRTGADASPAEIRDAIETTEGLIGFDGTFTFSPTDHNGLTTNDLALYRIEKGVWVAAK